jgi:hypothetical protein
MNEVSRSLFRNTSALKRFFFDSSGNELSCSGQLIYFEMCNKASSMLLRRTKIFCISEGSKINCECHLCPTILISVVCIIMSYFREMICFVVSRSGSSTFTVYIF